jgi:hypothetical protein
MKYRVGDLILIKNIDPRLHPRLALAFFPFAFSLTFAFFAFTLIIHLVLSQRLKNILIYLKKAQQKMTMVISGIHKLMVKNTISTKMKLKVRW